MLDPIGLTHSRTKFQTLFSFFPTKNAMKSWTQGRHLPTTRLFVWPPHDFRHLWIVSLSLAVVTSSSLWTLFPSAVQAQQPPTKPTVKNAMMMTTTTQSSTTKTAAAKSSVTSDDGSVATALPELTNELVTEILHYKGIYADQEEEDACRVRFWPRRKEFHVEVGILYES